MIKPISLFQGDSSGLIKLRPNITDPNVVISDDWECKTSLLNNDGTVVIAPRTESMKTDDDLFWIVGLSPSDTEDVTIDQNSKYNECTWVIQVSNNTLDPAYNKELHIQVNVRKQGIPNG